MTRSSARRVVVTIAVTAVLAACAAAAVSRPRAPGASADGGEDAMSEAALDVAVDEPVDGAALRMKLAPGMREVAHERLSVGDAGVYELAPVDVDRCYRMALLAADIVDATLTDETGHVLATARGKSPTLGAKGPVCLRKGQRAVVGVRGSASVELFVWTAP